MKKTSSTAKSALCSLASVLSSGVLMAGNVSAATINYYSGAATNDGSLGTSALQKDLGYTSGKDNKYRGLYEVGSTNGVLDSGSKIPAGVTAFEDIIKAGFEFNTWKTSYYRWSQWNNNGDKAPGTNFSSTEYNLRAVAQWTDLKKAVFANGSTTRMVVGTPFEVMDDDVKIGEINLSYLVNTTRDAEGATKATPLAVTSIDEKITFVPDEANGYELKKVETKVGDADAEDATEYINDIDGVLTLGIVDVKTDINLNVEMGLKEFTVTAAAAGAKEDAHVIVENGEQTIKYGEDAIFNVTVDEGYKITDILKDGEETELEVVEGKLTIEDVTADAVYTFVVEPEIYTIIEGDNQEVDLTKIDKALFRFDGPFELFKGVAVDGKMLNEDEYEAYAGSTYVAIDKAQLLAFGNGEHDLMALYDNGTHVATTFTVSGAPTSPDTGVNSSSNSALASAITFAATGSVLGLVMLAIKRKQNR